MSQRLNVLGNQQVQYYLIFPRYDIVQMATELP